MHVKRIQSHVLSLLVLVSLSACSGSGDTPTPSPTAIPAASAEGLWTGTIDTNRTAKVIVFDDGVFWILYYSAIGTPSGILGFIQGNSSSQIGSFTSSNAKDFNPDRQALLNANIDGTYTTKQSLNGTISYQNSAQDTFKTAYDSDYDLTPDITVIAGTYTGSVAANETATVTVSSVGAFSGSSSTGCTFTGSFSPRTHGNVFNVTVTFGGQDACGNGSETVNGIGIYDMGAKKLYSAALNGTRTNGFVFIGSKP